ncbi:MAG: hypothetical protein WAL98_10055 [Desulfatiglandaceae bacterium]
MEQKARDHHEPHPAKGPGHGMLGVSTAQATGKIVSQIATGQTSIDVAPLDLERFS